MCTTAAEAVPFPDPICPCPSMSSMLLPERLLTGVVQTGLGWVMFAQMFRKRSNDSTSYSLVLFCEKQAKL